MPTVALSASFIRSSCCPIGSRKIDYFDDRQRGFLLEVRESGRKTFYQRYTDSRGRSRQFKIGAAEILTLDQARRGAKRISAEVLLGADPHQKRRDARLVPKLAEFAREKYLPFVQTYKSTWHTDETILRIHILPRFGTVALDEMTPDAITEHVNRMRADNYANGTINRVIVILRYMFNLARKWKTPGVTENPAANLSAGPDVQRNRYLNEVELENLVDAIRSDENSTAARAILLLLLTGARRNEITFARWDYIDWNNRTLLVPRSKSGKARVIALNQSAIAVLSATPHIDGNPFILPSPVTGRPSASLFFPWDRIRKRAGLEDVRLHDLRHSFASFLVNRGVSLYVVQGLLGHQHARTTQRYAHLSKETLSGAAELLQQVISVPVDGNLDQIFTASSRS